MKDSLTFHRNWTYNQQHSAPGRPNVWLLNHGCLPITLWQVRSCLVWTSTGVEYCRIVSDGWFWNQVQELCCTVIVLICMQKKVEDLGNLCKLARRSIHTACTVDLCTLITSYFGNTGVHARSLGCVLCLCEVCLTDRRVSVALLVSTGGSQCWVLLLLKLKSYFWGEKMGSNPHSQKNMSFKKKIQRGQGLSNFIQKWKIASYTTLKNVYCFHLLLV